MSIQEAKQALADAMSTVPGVKGYANRPRTLTKGTAFVRWRGWSRDDGPAGAAFLNTFSVILVLPSTEEQADEWAYEHADLIETALAPVMWVESFQPTMLPTEAGEMFTLTITGRVE